MKNLNKIVSILAMTLAGSSLCYADKTDLSGADGSGGGDSVEPLFMKAQIDAAKLIGSVKQETIEKLQINESFKNWLRDGSRLSKLQFYTGAMKLEFQEGPCMENSFPRGACFDDSDPQAPRMIVSRSFNRMTTPDQAEALVMHEAGHFTGEMDHLFLSQFGVEMSAQQYIRPTIYKAQATERSEASHMGLDCAAEASYLFNMGFADCFPGVRIESACKEARKSAAEAAIQVCLAAGNSKCTALSSIEVSKEDHIPFIGVNWASCTAEAVASNQSSQ